MSELKINPKKQQQDPRPPYRGSWKRTLTETGFQLDTGTISGGEKTVIPTQSEPAYKPRPGM